MRFTWLACKYGVANHSVTAAVTKGIPIERAVYLPSILGLGNLLLRMLSTVVLNIKAFNRDVYFLVGILSCMSAALIAALASSFESMAVVMALVGMNEGNKLETTLQSHVNLYHYLIH